jgi:hypothetical protein
VLDSSQPPLVLPIATPLISAPSLLTPTAASSPSSNTNNNRTRAPSPSPTVRSPSPTPNGNSRPPTGSSNPPAFGTTSSQRPLAVIPTPVATNAGVRRTPDKSVTAQSSSTTIHVPARARGSPRHGTGNSSGQTNSNTMRGSPSKAPKRTPSPAHGLAATAASAAIVAATVGLPVADKKGASSTPNRSHQINVQHTPTPLDGGWEDSHLWSPIHAAALSSSSGASTPSIASATQPFQQSSSNTGSVHSGLRVDLSSAPREEPPATPISPSYHTALSPPPSRPVSPPPQSRPPRTPTGNDNATNRARSASSPGRSSTPPPPNRSRSRDRGHADELPSAQQQGDEEDNDQSRRNARSPVNEAVQIRYRVRMDSQKKQPSNIIPSGQSGPSITPNHRPATAGARSTTAAAGGGVTFDPRSSDHTSSNAHVASRARAATSPDIHRHGELLSCLHFVIPH